MTERPQHLRSHHQTDRSKTPDPPLPSGPPTPHPLSPSLPMAQLKRPLMLRRPRHTSAHPPINLLRARTPPGLRLTRDAMTTVRYTRIGRRAVDFGDGGGDGGFVGALAVVGGGVAGGGEESVVGG